MCQKKKGKAKNLDEALYTPVEPKAKRQWSPTTPPMPCVQKTHIFRSSAKFPAGGVQFSRRVSFAKVLSFYTSGWNRIAQVSCSLLNNRNGLVWFVNLAWEMEVNMLGDTALHLLAKREIVEIVKAKYHLCNRVNTLSCATRKFSSIFSNHHIWSLHLTCDAGVSLLQCEFHLCNAKIRIVTTWSPKQKLESVRGMICNRCNKDSKNYFKFLDSSDLSSRFGKCDKWTWPSESRRGTRFEKKLRVAKSNVR